MFGAYCTCWDDRMFLVHAVLSIAAYTTKHAGTAIAAIGMNVPLLWLTVSVKRLDDANYDVVNTMSNVLMDFIELPMGKTVDEIQSYNTCLKKMQVHNGSHVGFACKLARCHKRCRLCECGRFA